MSDFYINKVRKTTVTSAILEEFIRILIEGEVKPGDRIPPEQELEKMLGVGRSSVREVLSALELIGIIERRPGVGTYICDDLNSKAFSLIMTMVAQNTSILFEARKVIEVGLASLAAEKATQADIQRLNSYLSQMEESIDDKELFISIDLKFHLYIAEMCQNSFLRNMMTPLSSFLNAWREKSSRARAAREMAIDCHTEILARIEDRDPIGASAAMLDHLNRIQEFFLKERRDKSKTPIPTAISSATKQKPKLALTKEESINGNN